MRSAFLAPSIDPAHLINENGQRPGDIYLPRWNGCKPLAIDVTITNPLNVDIVSKASTIQGAAAASKAEMKIKKHRELCIRNNMEFLPFAVETHGLFCDDGHSIIDKIACLIARNKRSKKSMERKRLVQRLSVCLQINVARMFIRRQVRSDLDYYDS